MYRQIRYLQPHQAPTTARSIPSPSENPWTLRDGHGSTTATTPYATTVAEQQAQCFQLKRAGHSVPALAAIVGLSISTVQERITGAIAELVYPLAEQGRPGNWSASTPGKTR